MTKRGQKRLFLWSVNLATSATWIIRALQLLPVQASLRNPPTSRRTLLLPLSMKGTPRTLIRGAVAKDVGNQSPESAKNLMKSFIGSEPVSPEHKKILDDPAFTGYYPRIVNSVFFLERYASEVTRFQKTVRFEDSAFNGFNGFTGFEHLLICLNFSLLTCILITALVLVLFFLFVNNALYIREEIS